MDVVDECEKPRLLGDRPEQELDRIRIVVLRLEGDAEHLARVSLRPLRQQRRLAVPGRRDDRRHRGVHGAAQPGDECSAHDRAASRRGHGQASLRQAQSVRKDHRLQDAHRFSLLFPPRPAKGVHRLHLVGEHPPPNGTQEHKGDDIEAGSGRPADGALAGQARAKTFSG